MNKNRASFPSHCELKSLKTKQLDELAQQLRECIIQTVSQNGGHLASSLGAVELIVALHSCFETPKDKLLFDVGHQAYAHKLLTQRVDRFNTLRQDNGLSGFPLPDESEHDAFIAGHAGSALSAGLGLCVARDTKGEAFHVVSVVGDASMGCGISFEALNNASQITERMIVVLNDNRMAISPNVGALTRYLNKLIINKGFNRLKASIKKLISPFDRKNKIRGMVRRMEEALKMLFLPTVIFEDLGFRYLGPIDGHDIKGLKETFERAKTFDKPTLIHVVTTKGKGFKPAVEAPEKFHGLGQFDPLTGIIRVASSTNTFSKTFGETMCLRAEKNKALVVITAAMTSGTGLSEFATRFPQQLIDVGIAEEHALIFAAGLAKGGLHPVVALYATFLQRALGPLLHDICLQNLPVTICCDRAGAVDDGPTHHGIHDLGYLIGLPHLSILQPKNEIELDLMINAAQVHQGPVVIRYPKGGSHIEKLVCEPIKWGKSELIFEGKEAIILAVGAEVSTALQIRKKLQNKYDIGIVNVRFIAPLDLDVFTYIKGKKVFVIEDHVVTNGFSSVIAPHVLLTDRFGWENQVIPHGTVKALRKRFGFDVESLCEKIDNHLKEKEL